jgi:3',5'-cyclic AMP phosphodiesterase CpdA
MTRMAKQNEKAAFKFAVITDTHIRSPLGDQSSPYAVNEKANGRARFAVHLLQQLEHEFVVHLGDMVHPLPHMDAYQAAADEAHRIFRPLTPDLYFVPGNHDSGDKKSDVSPAGAANAQSVASYEAAFARSHYCFEHQDILFIIINSSLINGETGEEESQRAWLLETIAQAKGKRMFLFSHYPPFICYPDEGRALRQLRRARSSLAFRSGC